MHVTPCECQKAGWCERHKVEKSRFEFEQCRRMQATYEAWERGDHKSLSAAKPAQASLDCVHRGDQLDAVRCPTCRGAIELKVFACRLHGSCTLSRSVSPFACCLKCSDRTLPEKNS